jgi:rod shape determining protein RodA
VDRKRILEGTQTKGGFVPEQHTDYIFTTVGEEWGFAGSIVIGLFVTLFLSNLSCRKKKLSLVAFMDTALLVFLFTHFFCKHCNGYWIFPIGVPLPFFLLWSSGLWGFTILLFIFLKMDANKVNEW